MNKTIFKGKSSPFIMELPPYRMPSAKSTALLVWSKAKDFLIRAFTVIFVAAVAIWFFQTFDIRFNVVSDSANSMLSGIGRLVAPIFYPLGFNDWRAVTALVTGFIAKEAVVSTLAVLLGSAATLSDIFTPLAAFAFLVFTLLYTPCVATVAVTKRELGTRFTIISVILQTGVAYFAALVIYRIGSLFM